MITRRNVLTSMTGAICPAVIGAAVAQSRNAEPATSEFIAQILASPDRTPADRTNDVRRRPQAMLAFIGIRPGITALDLSAAGGYTTAFFFDLGVAGVVVGAGLMILRLFGDPSHA